MVDARRLHSAELDPQTKNQLSHRGQAVRTMLLVVAGLLNLKDMSRHESPDEDDDAAVS